MHKLTNLNAELKTANCSICGPVKISSKGSNKWRCRNLYNEKMQKSYIQRTYKLTTNEYEKLLSEQNGKCAICSTDSKPLVVDHDHACCPGPRSCGSCVRGLLCSRCNTVLGKVQDSPQLLSDMIKYLA